MLFVIDEVSNSEQYGTGMRERNVTATQLLLTGLPVSACATPEGAKAVVLPIRQLKIEEMC